MLDSHHFHPTLISLYFFELRAQNHLTPSRKCRVLIAALDNMTLGPRSIPNHTLCRHSHGISCFVSGTERDMPSEMPMALIVDDRIEVLLQCKSQHMIPTRLGLCMVTADKGVILQTLPQCTTCPHSVIKLNSTRTVSRWMTTHCICTSRCLINDGTHCIGWLQVWDRRSQSQVHVVQRFQPFKPSAGQDSGALAQEMKDVKFVCLPLPSCLLSTSLVKL